MKKTTLRKLKLNKKTVTTLNGRNMAQVYGGVATKKTCATAGFTCTQTCPSNTAIC